MKLSGKRVMVVGLGRSGVAAARLLAARGAQLVLVERNLAVDRAKLPPAQVYLGADDPAWLAGVDLVVTSPSVPRDATLISEAVARRIPVIAEVELAAQFLSAPIVAITGTNGKSTVTALLAGMLKGAGMTVFVGGSLGAPLIDAVDRVLDALVVEVSSFQLEWIEHFRPKVGIHLNLSGDRSDRDLGDYGTAMARLFENQDGSDWAVLNCDDSNVWKLARSVRSRVFGFGFVPGGKPAIWPEGKALVFDMGSRRGRISLEGFRLPGGHNVSDAMAAAAGALAMFADERVIEQTLRGFVGLPHRIELVREQDGVKWIDDAKATNVGAVVEALDAVAAPLILIAGGLDNGADYTPLIGPIHRKVKCAILNGAARKNIAAMLTGATQIELVPGLQEAVERAAAIALPGDTVLLSPACSSFDQFRDYAELGDVFKELVRAIP